MSWKSIRRRLAPLAAATPFICAAPTAALAQEPTVEVFYSRLDPKEPFKYKYKGQDGTCSAGVFRWEVRSFAAEGLDKEFTGYCAEVLVPIVADKTYRFQANNLYDPKNYNLDGIARERADEAANRRTRFVQELFVRYYRDPAAGTLNPTDAVALQVALWEVIQESVPAEGEAKLDLFAGDFQANYPMAEAPAYVKRAQEFLNSLSGEPVAVENPDLRGRELIRLQGVPNAEGVVAQSQYALRVRAAGGAAGGGLARTLNAGGGGIGFGGAPLGGLGGVPGGGFGGGAGGGGAFFPGNNNGNGRTVTNGNDSTSGSNGNNNGGSSPPPLMTSVPPVGGPIDSGDPNVPPTVPPVVPPTVPPVVPPTVPPVVPPTVPPVVPPTNPIPAPPGVVLGGVAAGTMGLWRLLNRRRKTD